MLALAAVPLDAADGEPLDVRSIQLLEHGVEFFRPDDGDDELHDSLLIWLGTRFSRRREPAGRDPVRREWRLLHWRRPLRRAGSRRGQAPRQFLRLAVASRRR